jgi:CheY-like chemotaxis protein
MTPAANTKILVVEDEAIVALDIGTRLIQEGYDVSGVCVTGEDAIQRAAEGKPDLVLMDIMLGGKRDGIQAARTIKSLYGIPVIFLTACRREGVIEEEETTQHSGFLPKPFDARALRTIIETTLRKHKTDRERKLRMG